MAAGSSTSGAPLQLFFRGEKLRDMDTFSKSDTYVVVTPGNNASGKHAAAGPPPVGRTETRKDDLNPRFETAVSVDFIFETKQEFTVQIFDDDGKGPSGDDLVGQATFQLAHVVGSRESTLKVSLKPCGTLYITGKEKSQAGRDTVRLKFHGQKLKNMDMIGKTDGYYTLSRILPGGGLKQLHKSMSIDNDLNPKWPATPALSVAHMTTGDMSEKTIRFQCFDEDMTGDDEMGGFDCSFYELMEAQRSGAAFTLKNRKGKAFGDIVVAECSIKHYPTFVEYLRGGLQVNLAVSVDFTGSNGNPRDQRSLHFMNPQQPNHYVRALMSVGDVLMPYDSDSMIAAFGFGAQEPMPSNVITHFFHLNGMQNPYVQGVQGVIDSYGQALGHMRLAGPTNFAPTVRNVRALAQQQQNTYTILLILTDGEITDMSQTIAEIVECDDAPMSVIIVGVGHACDFEMMDQLDGDGQRLGANGKRMKRDIVQFVPFRKFESAPPHALAAEVLREVPNQVVDWAMNVGRPPNPAGAGGPPPPQS